MLENTFTEEAGEGAKPMNRRPGMQFDAWRQLAMALVLLGLVACGAETPTGEGEQAVKTINGTVIYRERMRLPPGAQVEVELQDISRADAPASTLATVMLPGTDGPPYAFSIEYDPADIDQRRRYALRATITGDERLLFTSTEYIDPFAGGAQEILVRRVPAPEPEPGAGGEPVTLEGTLWLLGTLEGQLTGPGAGARPLSLTLDAEARQVTGFSGCNPFSGRYQRDGESAQGGALSFGPLAGTLKACEEGGELERRFLDALATVDAYRLDGDALILLAGDGEVATFNTAEDDSGTP